MSEDLTLDLAIIRNRFLSGKADARDDALLKEAVAAVLKDGANSPYRAIVLWAIDNAAQDMRIGNLAQAAIELDLAHTIPLSWQRPSSWDEELFLKGTLVEYVGVAPVDRIKALFAMFCTAQSHS